MSAGRSNERRGLPDPAHARDESSELATALRESEERFRLAAWSTSDIIYEWHLASGEIHWFGEVEELLRCDADHVPRLLDAFLKLVHPEDVGRVTEAARAGLRARQPWKGEYRVVRADGSVAYWQGSGVGRYDESEEPRSVIGAISDITERRQSEDALRARESRYRALFEQSTDGIYLHDHDGRIVEVNRTACEHSGYTREELLALNVFDLHPEGLPPSESIRQQWAQWQLGDRFTVEGFHRRKDGTVFPVEVSTGLIHHDGVDRLLAVVRDISARKQAEEERERLREQLAQSQKMESVGRLAGGVAHDFNNMLLAIAGNVEIALDETEPDSPIRGELNEIRKAAERSADLTRQLLAFARKQTISPSILDLNQAVTSSLKMLLRLIGEEVELVWTPAPGIWPVRMDPTQIDQILTNLCVNARDAISGPGRITIETGAASVADVPAASPPPLPSGDYTTLTVRDDGSGMDSETQARLFEPFFTTKSVGAGTGLGLSTVHGIVRQNGGHITVESELGGGSSFRIYLPKAVAEATEDTPASTPPTHATQRGGETILVVEDEPAVLLVAQRILEGLGYTVLAADGPSRALEIARERELTIDLLVTDVVMPEMNGRQLVDALREERPDLRCVFMSGYASSVIVHRGVLDEGVCFIQKPFSFETLAAKVREALDS